MIGSAALKIVHLFRLVLGTARPETDAQQRYAAIGRGAASAVAARVVGLIVGFLLVPLTVGYLGAERYGVWMTLSSTLTWLYLADLGIVNGLTNALARSVSLGERSAAQSHVATAFWLLAAIAAGLGAAWAVTWPFVDWAALFNVRGDVGRGEVRTAVGLAVALYLAAFPFVLLDKVYAAYRQGAIANAWVAADSVAALAAVLAVTHTRGGLVALVLALSGSHLAVVMANALWLFGRHLPEVAPALRKVSRASMRTMGGESARFFIIQIIGLVLFSTDNIIIARVLGPSAVTPYSVAWKLFTIPTLFVTLHAPYIWPAYSEARARHDVTWIRRALALSAGSSLAVSVVLAVPLAFFGQAICRAWAGADAVPTVPILWWMAAWAVISAPATSVSLMLNGMGRLKGQMIYGGLAAATNLWLSIWWARTHGASGVIAATVVSYFFCAALPAAGEAFLVLRALGSGREEGVTRARRPSPE